MSGLQDTYGDEFEQLYLKYEQEGKAREKHDIIHIWDAIISSQERNWNTIPAV